MSRTPAHHGATGATRIRTARVLGNRLAQGTRRVAALELTASVRTLQPSATLLINEMVTARRAAGKETIHLGFGQASFPLPASMRVALAASATHTAYPPVLGFPELRAAIAGYLTRVRGQAFVAEQVCVGPGSKPMIYVALHALDGDLLLPVPSWVSYAPQARLLGKRIIPVATDSADHLRLTRMALAGALARARHEGANPRILIVNSPSNPTGGMLAEGDVVALAEWARAEGITLISDEIYAELAHGWRAHISPVQFYPEGTIITGSLSKPFSAGGWRLGYLVVPLGQAGQRLLSAVRALASEIWSGAAGPIQAAAVNAYADDPEIAAYLRQSAQLHGHIAARLQTALAGQGARCPRPAGAFYLYPDFAPWRAALAARGIQTSMDLARHLLDNWGIATLPGSEFGDKPSALRLRLATSMLCEPDRLATHEARETALWESLRAADALPTAGDMPTPLPLPALDRAIEHFGEFTTALGTPSSE